MSETILYSPADMVDFLTGQHQRIRELFDETLLAAGAEREECFVRLRRLLAVHETAEQEIAHPRARHELRNGGAVVDARLAEEKHAKAVLAHLEDVNVDSEFFTEKLRELRNAVLDHAAHEERDEFAGLHAELSSTELELMERAVKLAEAVAPTRAHPDPQSARAQALVGPFASMVDQARDEILGYGSMIA